MRAEMQLRPLEEEVRMSETDDLASMLPYDLRLPGV
jgi:hypothetical protein